MHAVRRVTKKLFFLSLVAVVFLSARVPRTDAITCSPPTIVTGCTEVIAGTGVIITATVPPPLGTVAPTVETDSATSITATTATLGGILTDTGGALATVEGFSYGETTSYDTTTLNSGSFDVGAFSASLTGLVCATTYHFRAYATNPVGTGDGSDMTFTTAACPIIPDILGGGGHTIPTESTVNFLGTAYPGAHVVILEDGIVMIATTAGPDGSFVATVAGVGPGSYIFSAYAEDTAGRYSSFYSFPFVIDARSLINVTGILIPPTITLDKTTVAEGDAVTVSGSAAPNSVVSIVVDSTTEKDYSTLANGLGQYSFAIGTAGFTQPTYSVATRMIYGGKQSPYSHSLLFHVTGADILPDTQPNEQTAPVGGYCGAGQGDLNCDGHVNLIDFTIMKSWYRKPNPPAIVDLSGDGQITLKDFSILTSDWTG